MKTFGWLSSIRAIAVILTFGLLYIGVFQNKITGDNIMAIATGVVIGYFGKRDVAEDRGKLNQ